MLTLLNDGDVELRSLHGGDKWSTFCAGAPVLVTKSSTTPENKNCRDGWTNLSCTCLSELQYPVTEWEFHVSKRDASTPILGSVPNSTTDGVVAVSSIGAFGIPADLTSLCVAFIVALLLVLVNPQCHEEGESP